MSSMISSYFDLTLDHLIKPPKNKCVTLKKVASEILSNSKLSDRVSLIEFFMDTALACCRLGNFNSCMAITAGLSLPVVSRLSKTWQKVEETKFRVLQHICCPQRNFQNYRVILKVYGTESRVMIPIFSVFLKDCFFRLKPCVEGCSETEKELKVRISSQGF